MNNLFTIKAIKAGTLTLPKDSLAGGAVDADLMIEFPFTCFLLRNGEENILVDTGMKQSYLDQMAIGECHPTGSTQHLLDGLAEERLTPADITSVIYTHLHYDHCANGDLFTDVPNYVQKREYDNMKNPYDFQTARMDYFPDTAEWIAKVKNLILVNGDVKLANGIELYLSKGHSLGGQTVVVPTAKGRYVLTGDTPNLSWSLFPYQDKMLLADGSEIPVTPVTKTRFALHHYITDQFSAYDTFHMQLALAEKPEPEYFLGSHDPGNIYKKYWG